MAAEPEDADGIPDGNLLGDPKPETGSPSPQVPAQQLSPRLDARWKAIFYENMQPRALTLQKMRVEKLHRDKMLEKKLERKSPPDQLTQDWFCEEKVALETRAFLLDKLLPTLVPAVEKLLKVAERKDALEMEEFGPRKLDPIIFLGEYLMRHNPAYEISAAPNPYVRGMKGITEELKARVPETTRHKLTQMKALVKEKRQQREEVEKIKGQVEDMRKEALLIQFREWTTDASGQIPLALIQSALKSFLQAVSTADEDGEAGIFARPLEMVGTLAVKVNEEEFAEYLHSYVKNFTSDMFEKLLKHLLQCANDARDLIRHDVWRQMFLQLFFHCDHGKLGLLDRLRILYLLEIFYDNLSLISRKGFCDPRKWPVMELDDIILTEFWGNMEEDEELSQQPSLQEPPPLSLSEEAIALTHILKDLLSEPDLPVLGAVRGSKDLLSASQEAARLEEKDSLAGRGSQVVPARASQEQAGPALQEDPAEETPVGAPEGEVVVPAEGEGVAGDVQAEPSQVILGKEEANGKGGAEGGAERLSLASLSAMAEQAIDRVMGSGPEAGSEDQDVAAVDIGAEGVVAQEEPGEKEAAKGEEGEKEAAKGEEGEKEGVQEEQGEKEAAKGEEGEEAEEEGHPILSPSTMLEETVADTALPPPAESPSSKVSMAAQLVYGETWSGDLQTADLAFRYTDYRKEIREDWNHENTRFPDLRMNMIEIQARGPPSSTSAFDKHSLNVPQFVQLMETFVGPRASLLTINALLDFLAERYVQTEKEKIDQLQKVHCDSFLVRRQLLLAALFEKWDNECSGFLDMEEVDTVLATFKEGMEQEALNKAKLQLPIPQWHPSGVVKLYQKDFQAYIELVVSELTGDEDEVLDNMVEFLMTSVERSHTERLRGGARRKWLRKIEHLAKTNGGCLEPVYKAVFKALSQDADAHGGGKKISANIALLEYNLVAPERGDILLRYVACTEDDAPHVLNQTLFMDMEGVSFAAALDDKPIHVPRVQLHGNVHFWNESRPPEERKGSFLVLPLEDVQRRVFGVLGLDTLRDESDQAIFVPHEIRFYQGIANSFSVAYHHIRTQDCIKQVLFTAAEWLAARAPGLQALTAYFMEPSESRVEDYTLRKVLTSDPKGQTELHPSPGPTYSRKEDVFRDYLFKCIDTAMVVTAYFLDEYHTAVPLRDPKGQAIGTLDLNFGRLPTLPACQRKDLQKMLKMTQAATLEIVKEDSGDLETCYVLEAEYVGDWRRGGVLFYRFMLQDLQNCIWNLDPWLSFGEIRCFEEPPHLVHTVLKCVLLILYPQWAGTLQVEDWDFCIQRFDGQLIENVCYFDPTAAHVEVKPELLFSYLQDADREAVWKFGSAPIEYFYNWAHTCLSLIFMAKKLQHHRTVATSSSVILAPSLTQSVRSLRSVAGSDSQIPPLA